MVQYLSPGVYTVEKDFSQFATGIISSRVGVVGFAGKGPTNKPVLITSQNQLLSTFGPPSDDLYGQAINGALEILEATDTLYFVRAADTAASNDASATVNIGTCPAVGVSGPTTVGEGFGVTEPLYIYAQVYDNNGTAKFVTPKTFNIPAATIDAGASNAYQAVALQKAIGGSLDADELGVFYDSTTQVSGNIVGAYAGSGSYMSLSAFSDSTLATGVSCLAPVSAIGNFAAGQADVSGGDVWGAVKHNQEKHFPGTGGLLYTSGWASSVTVYGTTVAHQLVGGGAITTSGMSYHVESLEPGAGYNAGTTNLGAVSGNSVEIDAFGGPNNLLTINEDGTAKETFKVSLVSGAFVEDVINTGETNLKSEVVKGNLSTSAGDLAATALDSFYESLSGVGGDRPGGLTIGTWWVDPLTNAKTAVYGGATSNATLRYAKFIQGTYNLSGGTNGGGTTAANNAALIGDATAEPKTGMQSLDDESVSVDVAVVPGVYDENVQNALITLAESTGDFLAVVSPPYGIGTVQDAIDWSNGKSASTAGSRTAAINSSYAAIYFPHLKVFDVFSAKDIWLDPAIYGVRQMLVTDNVTDPWFAPAGYQRGRLTKPADTEVKLNQGDRDSLYGGGNVINPIANFVQQGITVFGQRTAQRTTTATNRINIRRLLIALKKLIISSTRSFVFEPNDEFTWKQIETLLNPALDDIRNRRGITEFRVVCDDTTNTPVKVDRNELWCKVLIKPTKTAEVLVFEINLTNQSAQLGVAE